MTSAIYDKVVGGIKTLGCKHLHDDDHVFLYGSRARGDAHQHSDWDVLVLLNKPCIEQSDYDGIVYELTALGWNLGEMIIPVVYTNDEWKSNSYTPFYKSVESEGIRLI